VSPFSGRSLDHGDAMRQTIPLLLFLMACAPTREPSEPPTRAHELTCRNVTATLAAVTVASGLVAPVPWPEFATFYHGLDPKVWETATEMWLYPALA
jgi:hypothetical protein